MRRGRRGGGWRAGKGGPSGRPRHPAANPGRAGQGRARGPVVVVGQGSSGGERPTCATCQARRIHPSRPKGPRARSGQVLHDRSPVVPFQSPRRAWRAGWLAGRGAAPPPDSPRPPARPPGMSNPFDPLLPLSPSPPSSPWHAPASSSSLRPVIRPVASGHRPQAALPTAARRRAPSGTLCRRTRPVRRRSRTTTTTANDDGRRRQRDRGRG